MHAFVGVGWGYLAALEDERWSDATRAERSSRVTPIVKVSQEAVPVPYNESLEKIVLPSVQKIIHAVKTVCYRS